MLFIAIVCNGAKNNTYHNKTIIMCYLFNANNSYFTPNLRAQYLDVYIVRTAILRAITDSIDLFRGIVLDVGCGEMPYKELLTSSPSKANRYIGLDLENNPVYTKSEPDMRWDGKTIPLADNSVDCAIATEVLEHCPEPEHMLKEIYRVIKPDGILFFTVPFLWPLHDVPYDQYRYTPFSLERHLSNCGFEQIDIKALGGWDASLAQMIGLWVNRRPLSFLKRKIFQAMSLPIMRALIKRDTIPVDYAGAMFIGFSGSAKKPI